MLYFLLFPNLVLNSQSDAQLPEWEVGYTWNYKSTGLIPSRTVNLTYKVVDATDVIVNGINYKAYLVNSTNIMNIDGTKFHEYRIKYISKFNLSIIKIDFPHKGPLGQAIIRESVFTPPVIEYNFPLYLGKNWTMNYNETIKIGEEIKFNMSEMYNYTVVGVETLTVPPGSFECYKIEIDDGIGSIKYMWYSDEVRNLVKHTGEADEIPFEIELNSYSLVAKVDDDEDTNPFLSWDLLLPIIISVIIIVIIIASILTIRKNKKKEKNKRTTSKTKSKKKRKNN